MKGNNLIGLDREELIGLAQQMGEAPYRGRQLYYQIYRRKQFDFTKMTDLTKAFRQKLHEAVELDLPQKAQCTRSADGTVKFLFRLRDGAFIETVYIPEEGRNTLCISSQVGCDVGCTFCLTAQMGFQRNLMPGEIIGQVLRVIKEGLLREQGFNVVLMGMGEPFYNYKNVMKAFRIMTDCDGMNLSHRKITLSTSGVVPVLHRLAAEERLPNLAISLNATTGRVRNQIMPINQKWSLEELLAVCRLVAEKSRRTITFEYVLLEGENDTDEDAHRLACLLAPIPAKVNLIPYNPSPGLPHSRPPMSRVENFKQILIENGLTAFVRKTRGDDISAACGQLAHLQQPETLLRGRA